MTNLSGDIVGNRDDHLRNHGFLWGEDGWRLAPAFDMNPGIDKREHVLTIDGLIAIRISNWRWLRLVSMA